MLEVAQKYLQLKSGEYYKCFGKVDKVVGLTIESIGPKAKLNDLCMIFLDKERRDYVMSEVVGFKDSHIILMPFDNVEGVGVGCIVENTGHPLTVAVGDELLGHTVDGIGRVTDCDEKDGDPLQHLLRNSADHGLESNEVRLERGKPEVGTIFLNAYQEGNNVVIKVGDDGNGIDTEAVKNKAIERGIVTAEQAENLSQKDIINFLFMPSFSMAKQITDISGRGVGLDVVKSGIEQLGGDVSVSTELGKGTTFTVRLPLTLAIIQALMVEIRDEIYAIALGSISNIEDIPVKDIKYVQAKEVIHLRGSVIPIIRLDKMLDIEPKEQEPDHLTVVIVQKGDQQAGLVVDNLIGQQEIVIKSLGKYINGNKLISGATILGDGDVALILDVNTLM